MCTVVYGQGQGGLRPARQRNAWRYWTRAAMTQVGEGDAPDK